MAKSFPAHKIKLHQVYTVWEAAETLSCHRQTVIRWIHDKGLPADASRKPWLIEGHALKAFLGARKRKTRCKLALHQIYCLGCRAPRTPFGKIADYEHQTSTSGRLIGLCPVCESVMNKVIRRADLETIQAKIQVTIQQASPRIVSHDQPRSNVTFTEEFRTHGKTHFG